MDPSKLGPGTYNGTVSFAGGGASQSIAVTSTVTNNPLLAASPTSLWFAYQIGQSSPASQTVALTTATGRR